MIKETTDSQGRTILTVPYAYLRFNGKVGDQIIYNPYVGYCAAYTSKMHKPEWEIIEIETKGFWIFKKPSMVKLRKLD